MDFYFFWADKVWPLNETDDKTPEELAVVLAPEVPEMILFPADPSEVEI